VSTFIIAEIGINHNGDMEIAKSMIKKAHQAGADAIKFQKRTIDLVYPPETLNSLRESPFGTTYRQQKEGLEFSTESLNEIDAYCKSLGIEWFVSCWDIESQKYMRQYNLNYNKVASPMLTLHSLLREIASEKKYTFVSTGMSTLEEIEAAVNIFRELGCPFELMHCVSNYPLDHRNANLSMIKNLQTKFQCKVGYSGHEHGTEVSTFAVAVGATSIERHFTLDRTMYGSDQSSSIEPEEFQEMVTKIRMVEESMGNGEKNISETEMSHRKKLAAPYWSTQ